MQTKIKRALELLEATKSILEKCYESPHTIDPMSTEVVYDDAVCDGYCLLEDIKELLLMKDDPDVHEIQLSDTVKLIISGSENKIQVIRI